LWFNGDYALRYANIDKRLSGVEMMTPQPNLNKYGCMVTIILPTAFTRQDPRGVQRVHPSLECQQRMVAGGNIVDAYGLSGYVAPAEIVGATVGAICDAVFEHDGFLVHWYHEDENGPAKLGVVIDVMSRSDSDLNRFINKKFVLRG
jgi:hypothetical protein